MAPHYRLTRRAETDFYAIYMFTAREFGERQADRYADKLQRVMTNLLRHPEMGSVYRTANGQDFHRLRCESHWVFYQKSEDGVLVVRILHVAMNLEDHLT